MKDNSQSKESTHSNFIEIPILCVQLMFARAWCSDGHWFASVSKW
jgi:hypothetical protein